MLRTGILPNGVLLVRNRFAGASWAAHSGHPSSAQCGVRGFLHTTCVNWVIYGDDPRRANHLSGCWLQDLSQRTPYVRGFVGDQG